MQSTPELLTPVPPAAVGGLAARINWRERFIAAGVHLLITVAVAALAAAVIFFVWFPGDFAQMSGGLKLFLIVVGVDIGLGPLISLVIYSSAKARRQLVIDYSIVGAVQLAALLYGTFTVAVSRPVFVAFAHDRFEIVSAIELDDADLAMGTAPRFRTRSWTGPRFVNVELPTDAKERNEVLAASLEGKDAHLMPRYYRSYEQAHAGIDARAQSLDTLLKNDEIDPAAAEAIIGDSGVPREELRWLLVHHRFGFSAALIDRRTRQPVAYVPMREQQ
jgi:hypothetical protein